MHIEVGNLQSSKKTMRHSTKLNFVRQKLRPLFSEERKIFLNLKDSRSCSVLKNKKNSFSFSEQSSAMLSRRKKMNAVLLNHSTRASAQKNVLFTKGFEESRKKLSQQSLCSIKKCVRHHSFLSINKNPINFDNQGFVNRTSNSPKNQSNTFKIQIPQTKSQQMHRSILRYFELTTEQLMLDFKSEPIEQHQRPVKCNLSRYFLKSNIRTKARVNTLGNTLNKIKDEQSWKGWQIKDIEHQLTFP